MERPYEVMWWDDPATDFEARFPRQPLASRILRIGDRQYIPQYQFTAAVMAINPEHAKQQIIQAYSDEVDLEWIIIKEQPFGWIPKMMDADSIWGQRPH